MTLASYFEWSPRNRRLANSVCCAVHAALAVLSLADTLVLPLGTPVGEWVENGTWDATCPVDFPAPARDAGLCTTVDYANPLLADRIDLNVLCALYFGVSAGAHALYVLRYAAYEDLVRSQFMWWRWVEYSLSVPPMMMLIVLLSGNVLDVCVVQSAALASLTQAFGALADYASRRGSTARAQSRALPLHALGYVPMAAAFLPVVVAVRGLLERDDDPDFVVAIIATQTVFFTSFAYVQMLWLLRKISYEAAEGLYIGLSLGSKATLGYIVLFSVEMIRDS
jgi:hypothetical protein